MANLVDISALLLRLQPLHQRCGAVRVVVALADRALTLLDGGDDVGARATALAALLLGRVRLSGVLLGLLGLGLGRLLLGVLAGLVRVGGLLLLRGELSHLSLQ